jgi:hypothetical protein
MRNGVCPKCGAQTIHVRKTGGYRGRVVIAAFYWADIIMYVCTTCGYLEEYIEQQPALATIASGWPQMPVTAASPQYTPEAPTRRLPDLPRE